MGYILIAPEMVIVWAGRQHYAACIFAKKHKENHPGWTRVHAFFLVMGGFTLHAGGKPIRILEARELETLSELGKIEWPTITEDEIADRSKGDYLSKTIVLVQTTWFIAQCIARGVYGLDVTELEVVTLAFATLTGVIYFFWWDKPLNVQCSIPVQLLGGRIEEIQDNVMKEDTDGCQFNSPLEVTVSDQEKERKNTDRSYGTMAFSSTHSHHSRLKATRPLLIQPSHMYKCTGSDSKLSDKIPAPNMEHYLDWDTYSSSSL